MRVCQPLPVDLKYSITSGERRIDTGCLVRSLSPTPGTLCFECVVNRFRATFSYDILVRQRLYPKRLFMDSRLIEGDGGP